jgi:hypothetical protein
MLSFLDTPALHVGFKGDLGGNDIDGTFDGDDWNLHAIWDSAIIQDRLGDYNNDTTQYDCRFGL